jgi:two-component system, OmpR family, response regulator
VKLIVVEDEERVASFLEKGLRAHGYSVEWVPNGQDALQRVMDPGISLVILDLGLPDLDGLDVLEGMRQRGSTVPVLVLSARGRVDDRVKGLNLGADDYLAKPFAFEELLARVRANLRPRAAASPGMVCAGSTCVDPVRREVTIDGRTRTLPAREFSLLKAFAGHPGQVLSRQELLSMAWGMNFDPGTNLVDVYVGYLRRKLGETVIDTVRGAGYRLRADGQETRQERAQSPGSGLGTTDRSFGTSSSATAAERTGEHINKADIVRRAATRVGHSA